MSTRGKDKGTVKTSLKSDSFFEDVDRSFSGSGKDTKLEGTIKGNRLVKLHREIDLLFQENRLVRNLGFFEVARLS